MAVWVSAIPDFIILYLTVVVLFFIFTLIRQFLGNATMGKMAPVNGRTCDLSAADRFKTGNPLEPTIYINKNCQVFVAYTTPDGKESIRQATTPEIRALFEKYGIRPLMRAIR
jgi:hypothetical protein